MLPDDTLFRVFLSPAHHCHFGQSFSWVLSAKQTTVSDLFEGIPMSILLVALPSSFP